MDIPIKKKRFTRTKIMMTLGASIILFFIAYLLLSSNGKTKLNINVERISISTITAGVFQENIPVNGLVSPITTIYLDALEGGRVEEIYVEDGDIMKQNEPILRLSNTDLQCGTVKSLGRYTLYIIVLP